MTSKLSMADLLKGYSNRNQAPSYLNKQLLEGKNTLEKLEKLAFARSSSTLYAKPSNDDTIGNGIDCNTIAICLVIVEELLHEDIWKQWIEDVNTSDRLYKAKLIIHAKNPENIKSEWVKSLTLKHTYHPEWNSPEVVRAMLATLTEAIKDESCGRFVFGTETCLPMYTLQETGKILFKEDISWLQARKTPESQWESAACFLSVDQSIIPQKNVWKALPGWIMLTRRHAVEIVRLPTLVNADLIAAWGPGGQWSERKGGVFAPEEVYFATNLSILGYLRDNGKNDMKRTGDEVYRQRVTWAQWKKHGDANPITYSDFSVDIIRKFRSEGAVFARKFDKSSCNAQKWLNVINKLDGNQHQVNPATTTTTTTNDTAVAVENAHTTTATIINTSNNSITEVEGNSKKSNDESDVKSDDNNDDENNNEASTGHIKKKGRI